MSTHEIEQMVKNYQASEEPKTTDSDPELAEDAKVGADEPQSQSQSDINTYSNKISGVLSERRRLGNHIDRLQALIEQN